MNDETEDEKNAPAPVRRQRHRRFVKCFMDALARPGVEMEEAALEATRKVYSAPGGGTLSDRAARNKAKQLMNRDDVTGRIAELFDVAVAFSPVDFAEKLKEHIVTATEKDPLGSLEALKYYGSIALPKPAKQVNVDQRTLVLRGMATTEAPKMRARVLSSGPAEEAQP